MLKLVLLSVLAILIAGPIVASRWLPAWGIAILVVVEVVAVVMLAPRLLAFGAKRLALRLFETKSQVLRGATIQIHNVALTARLRSEEDAEEEGDEQEKDESRYVAVEFTLEPLAGQSAMAYYDPSELMLVPIDAEVSTSSESADDERTANVYTVRLITDAGDEEEIEKISGRARLRSVFSCPASLRGPVKFRYYFEAFGRLELP